MKQIRIVSDGMGSSTRVFLEDGAELRPSEATVWLQGNEINRVELTFVGPSLDIHADLHETTMVCPICTHSQTHYCPDTL